MEILIADDYQATCHFPDGRDMPIGSGAEPLAQHLGWVKIYHPGRLTAVESPSDLFRLLAELAHLERNRQQRLERAFRRMTHRAGPGADLAQVSDLAGLELALVGSWPRRKAVE